MVVRMFVKINFSSFFQAALAAFFPSASGSCSFFPSEAFFYFIMSWVGILVEMVFGHCIKQVHTFSVNRLVFGHCIKQVHTHVRKKKK